ncbi:Rad52/Rad22 family DNA repair protein [Pseudoalteromonas piscicida]|uniref:Rad52/Rad22 family DNA repair protein n=1 Tax=Pseudoalteromonas piscicida TaxID=43662 RepID=UPI00069877DD|nr:Rad52/Rad22 family DNA repair protein [Pseudoalteromonas piscicida]
MDIQAVQKRLSDPFEEHDLNWMVIQSDVDAHGPWVRVIPYVTNRAVQQRLDDVFGLSGWKNVYRDTPKGQLCGLKVLIGDQWITKWDGASYTDTDPLKGALSVAMKRASVQFGVGRYLYSIEPVFVRCQALADRFECTANYTTIKQQLSQNEFTYISAQWDTPALPAWALPSAKFDAYLMALSAAETETALKAAFVDAVKVADVQNRPDIKEQVRALRDKRLLEIEATAKQKRKQSLERFNAWLKQQIQYLEEAENESILEMQFKSLQLELRGQCSSLTLNKADYEARINQVKQQRISQLQGAH